MKLSKSKLALAKVINENGGWPERALLAVQDNCIAFFLGGKPEYKSGDKCWYSNSIDGACVGTITRDEKVTNWHQTILSREEYYQAYQKTDADGWIEWKGGECHVDFNDEVDVTFRLSVGSARGEAGSVRWSHLGLDSDIVAYRMHKPEAKPEFCESVTRSIPEPEAKPTIEQLAQDYRNAKDYALRLQEEANDAWTAAEKAKGELIDAGKAPGLVLSVAEPETVIADWRDLRVNAVIFVGEYDDYESGEYVVIELEGIDYGYDYAVKAAGMDGNGRWIDTTKEWRFIRRP